MPAPPSVPLSPAQEAELVAPRVHAATPYRRERAGAVLKVAAGWPLRRVAREGLPRRPGTVAGRVRGPAEARAQARVPPDPGRSRRRRA